MRSRNLVLSIILAILVLHLVSTSVLACDPRTQYCPTPTYQPPVSTGSWNSAVQRAQYDVGYVGQCAQQGYYQTVWIGGRVWDSAQTYPYGNGGQ